MVRAGPSPLSRALAHTRWAERYTSRGDQDRAAAHFGRALHYTQIGDSKGASFGGQDTPYPDSTTRAIFIGRWEEGKEEAKEKGKQAWAPLSEIYEMRLRDKRLNEVLRGHGSKPQKHPTYRFPDVAAMLDELYKSESSGIKNRAHRRGDWYIHRASETGFICLVPTRLVIPDPPAGVTPEDAADRIDRMITRSVLRADKYDSMLKEGTLIVQDRRYNSVKVKRTGLWGPATELETFAYFDFVLRYPLNDHRYLSEKKASEQLRTLESMNEGHRRSFQSMWTTIPRAYMNAQNEDTEITLTRSYSDQHKDRIYIVKLDNTGHRTSESAESQISDTAHRFPPPMTHTQGPLSSGGPTPLGGEEDRGTQSTTNRPTKRPRH